MFSYAKKEFKLGCNNRSSRIENNIFNLFLVVFLVLPANINAAIIAILVILMLLKKNRLTFCRRPLQVTLLLYIACNIFSIIYAKNIMLSCKECLTWIFFFCILCLSANKDLFNSNSFKFLLWGVVLFNAVYISGMLFNFSIFGLKPPTFNSAAIIDCLVALIIENRIFLKLSKNILFERMIQILCFFTIILSSVRGILAILLLYYIYYMLFKQKYQKHVSASRRIVNIISVVLLGAVMLYLLRNFWADYAFQMRHLFSSEVYSNQVRILLYKNEISYTIANHLWLGVGAGNFTEYYQDFAITGFSSNHSHSILIQSFVELGLVGFTLILVFFLQTIKLAFKLDGLYKLFYLELIATVLLYGTVEYVWVDLRAGLIIFICIGQLLFRKSNEKQIPNMEE